MVPHLANDGTICGFVVRFCCSRYTGVLLDRVQIMNSLGSFWERC